MKRVLLFLTLMGISVASGILMSWSSWIGKVGMTLIHREYNFTKVWWEGAFFVFALLMLLYFVHSLIQLLPLLSAKFCHLLLLATSITALYLTYDDFHTDISHRMLKHWFHYGVYLVWAGWVIIALFFLFSTGKKKAIVSPSKDKNSMS